MAGEFDRLTSTNARAYAGGSIRGLRRLISGESSRSEPSVAAGKVRKNAVPMLILKLGRIWPPGGILTR